MNERGLCMAALHFPDNARYLPPKPGTDNVASFEVIPWILSQCADLSQEGMIGFLSAVYSYRENGSASFLTYASRCIRNKILSALRKLNSTKRIPDSLLVSLEQISETSAHPDTPENLILSESGAKLISSLIDEHLSKQEKDVLMLYLTGISYGDIAEKLSLSSKAVDSALQRARKKLREKLGNNF